MYFIQMTHQSLLEQVLEEINEEDRERFLAAFKLASEVHGPRGGAETRGEGVPPIDHPVRVMYSLFAEQKINDADILIAALLHDVIEISTITQDEIEQRFGAKIAEWVNLLTRKPGIDRISYAYHIKEAPFEVFLIEMAGRLDNLRTAHRRKKSFQPYVNETRKYYLIFAEHRARKHPELLKYTDAIRMMIEGD